MQYSGLIISSLWCLSSLTRYSSALLCCWMG